MNLVALRRLIVRINYHTQQQMEVIMGYVDSVLLPGERVAYQSPLNWSIYLPTAYSVFLGALFLSFAPLVGVTLILFGVVLGVSSTIDYFTTEIAVTSHRIIVKRGWVGRKVMEMNLNQVESVILFQSVLGRMFNYGMISVLGTGMGIENIGPVDFPLTVRKRIQEAKAVYDRTRGDTPSSQTQSIYDRPSPGP